MSSVYPKYLDKFTIKKNETGNGNGDFIVAEHVNDLQDSIMAIEGVLGVNPQGTYINIAQRLVEQQKTQSLGLPKVAIYKGDPAIVNGVADIKKAAQQFAYFDNVILTGLNVYTNPVVNVMNVIGETKSLSGSTSFFGEIDAGLSTSGYSPEQIDILMNKWKEVGADGIYLSNFGYDKGSTRDRQNKLIDLAHEKDLFLIINSKNLNEILETININMNPEEALLNLRSTDIYLHFGLSLEAEGYISKDIVKSIANQLIDIRKTFGCKLFVIDYIEDSDVVAANQKYYYGQSVSMLYSLDGYYANRKVLQDRELKIYVSLPIVGDFYDSNPIITDNASVLKRTSSVGEIEINFNNFSYSFKNIKIPLGFIDLNDNTKIPASKIEGTFNADQINIDVVASINGIADGSAKINAEKIDFSTSGNDIIESINVVSENPSPKINSNAIGNLSVEHIREIVDQALKESLQEELDSGTYSASFIALMAAQISAINAYIANLDVDDLDAKFIDGKVIKAGSVEGYLFKGNTITSDKLTIQSTAGTNKWTAVAVNREGEGSFSVMKADLVLGKKVIKRAEYSENTVTTAVSSAALIYPTPLIAMWETAILCDSSFTLSPIFKSKHKSTLIVNNVVVVTATNNIETGYSFTLNPGWNTIRVVTDYANLVDSTFNLGFRFSDYALATEKGEPTGIIRMDGYADKVTQITGDVIETGTILVDHLQADTLSASNIKTGTLQAGVEIEVGTTVKLSTEDGIKVTGGKGIQVSGSNGISITEGSLVVLDGQEEQVQVGKYDTNKYGIKVSTKKGNGEAGFPILLNKDGLSAENFSVKPDGTIDLTGKITATQGQFIGQVIVGKETANPIIVLDGSIDNNPEIKISVDESIVEYEDATGQTQIIEVPGGYIRLSKEGIQVSENGIYWTTKLHANGLTIGTTDIGDGVITTDKLNVEEVNAGLVNAGMIRAMEAYIEELTTTNGNFENILVDMLQAKFINTTNISVYSEAKDGSGNTGFLFIDSGGMLVSSKVKNEQDKIPLDAHLVKIDRAGIKVSANGGQTWENKLTGAGLNVGKAEITSVYASAIVTGKIDINTSINVDDKVFIDGLGGITVTGSTGAGITVKEGHILVKDGASNRIIIGKQDDSTYGIKLNTTNGVITLDKRGLISPNFTIGTTGKIDAKDGNFSGTIKTANAIFGSEHENHVVVDSQGIVIGTGNIVDTRDESKQALRLDSEGIIAKQGIIGGLNIVAALDGQGKIIDSVIKGQKEIYNEVGHLEDIIDQFTFHPDTIEVTGEEAITINSGTLVVKEDDKVYLGVGKIDTVNSKYGIRVDMYDSITKNPTGKYIQLDQDGLRAFNGTINTININKDGNISVSGQIDATSGTLGSLTVQGQINIDNGSIKAGDVIIDKTGIEGTGFSLNTGGIVATQGSIGGWAIGDTSLSNGSINLNTLLEQITIPGVVIGKYEGTKYGIKAGDAVLNNTGLIGTGYSLTSSGVVATKGTIGGWTLASSGLSKGNISINSTLETITIKDEVTLGKYEGANYGLKAGTVILNKLGLTGTGFSIGSAGIAATEGSIGSWTIASDKLSSGNIVLDSNRKSIWIGSTYETAKIKLNDDGTAKIGIVEFNKVDGQDTYSLFSTNFKIKSNGDVTLTGAINATSGTFAGRIESSSGWFGTSDNGVLISADGLTAGNVNISRQGVSVGNTLKINQFGLYISDLSSSIQLGSSFLANKNGMVVSAGKIANWSIAENTIQDSSSSIILDSSSKQIKITDQVTIGEYGTGLFGIKAGETILNANGINANSGYIGGWELTPTSISSGNIKLDSLGVFKIAVNGTDKIKLNNDGSAKLGLLDISADGYISSSGLNIDNTGARFDGKITAASGVIGGWTIGSEGLSTTGVLIDSANKRILLGSTNQISISSTTGLNVNNGQFLVDLAGKLTAKDAVITGSITTNSLVATGGEIGDLIVKGNITAGDTILTTTGIQGTGYELKSTGLTATKGKIGGWTLGSTTLSSGNLTLDSTGVIKITVATVDKIRFNNDGSGKIGNLSIGTDGSITSSNFGIAANGSATFNGKITSTEGSIAGWTIAPQSISAGKITLDKDGKILLATNPSDITEYNLIDSTNFKVTNKGNVSLTGSVTATSGLIGGWDISLSQIKAGHLTLDSSGKIILAKGAQAAYDVITSPNFKLDSDGKIIATSAKITGEISATSGAIGGWTVTGTQIKSSAGEIILDSAGKRITVGSKVYLDSNGLTAEEDASNYLRVNNTGLRIIKNGTDVGAAITKDGIRGQLLTNQSVSGTSFDVLAPKSPTSISATSSLEQLATGDFVNINVSWVAPTQNVDNSTYGDAGGYKIYLKTGSGLFYPELIVSAAETSAVIRGVKPNTVYQVAVTAFDKTGNESLKGQTTAFTTVKDTVAPSKITGLSIIDGLLAFTLRWTKLIGTNNYDIDYYEINQSTNGTTWTLTGNVYTDFVTVKGLDYNANYYFRVRAVDLSGNAGVWSDSLFAGKPKQIGREDIVAGTITADELNIGSVVKSINTQQTTLFHFDGTLQSTQGLQPFVEIVDGNKVVHQSGFFKKEARFGASISMEEDTDNLIAAATGGNAHLRSNSNGWSIGTGSYIAINGVEGVDDGYLEVPYDDGGHSNKIENIVVEPGKEYTISVYAKSVDANSSIRIDAKTGNGTAWSATGGTLKSIITKATGLEWKRYSATFTIPAGSNTTKISVAIMQASGTGRVAVDSLQLEQRAYATSFVNGIKAEGYVDYYAPAILKRDEGTISFWMKSIIGWDKVTNNNHADTPYQDNLFIWGKPISSTDSQTNSIYAKYERDVKLLSVKYNGTANTASFAEFDPDSWVHFAFTWKNNEQILFINGKEMSRKTNPSMNIDPSDLLFRLGYIPRLDGSLNIVEEYVPESVPGEKKARSSCLFDELRIDRIAVNQEEIKSWYVQESSFYDASAQIDADSQNISAANASVTINNEGITIRDGKLHVISQDGQTLITGGRLQVNGLDIGIAQSDNNVYNGSFTVGDTSYGPGDVVQTPRGVEVWGAKYWKSRRSSGPMADQALLGATWNTVPLTNFIDPQEIWNYAEAIVDVGVRTAFKVPPNVLVQMETEKALLQMNPAASTAEKNACKLAAKNAMDALLINPASNTDSIITSSLGAYVVYNPLVVAVINAAKTNPALIQTPEALTSYGILSVAPTTPLPIVAIYQGIMRAVCNDFIDNYNLNTSVVISALASASLVGANAPYLALAPGMVALMENSKVILKQSIESAINEEATNKYDNIMNFHMGYLTWNNINGDKQMKVYHIASDEEEQKYGWQSGAIYEIESDIVSNIIKGQEVDTTPENIGRQIDPTTGLFKISTTPFTDGNTLYYVSPDGNHLGRIGYCELGVSGLNAQVNSIEQDLSKLKTYVDGNEEHFKQHTFSFHGIWNTEEDDSIVKSDTAQLAFEVEELIPMLQALPDENGMAKIIPSYEIKMKKEVEYNAQLSVLLETQIQIESNVPGSDFFGMYQPGIGPLIVSLLDYADKTILYNTNPITKQAMEIGNMNILDDKISYKIQAIRNADTIIKSVAETLKNMAYPGAGKAYVPYEYVPTGQKGVISVADKTCYLVEDQSYIDTSTKPTFTYESAVGEDNGNQVEKDLGWLTKKGDFISVIFQCQSEVDAKLFALQANDGANFNMYVDGVYFSTGTAWMPKSRHSTTEVVGFYSGLHMMTVAHTGEGWIYNKNKDNRIGFGGVEVFDWHSAKTVIEKIIDMHPLIPAGNKDAVKLELANKVNTQNKKVLSNNAKGEWEIVSIAPSICNSLDPFGYHWLPERTPVKYKAKCTLSKLGNDDEVSRVKITGIQCELGTNPSYTRISNGEGSIPGLMIQPYNKEMWRKSGIQTRHLQEHTSSYFLETGIYDRHIADRNVTSKKISYSAITNDHISNGNITYRKTRVNRTKIDKTIITVDDFIDKANLSSQEIMSEEKRLSKYLSFLPKTRLSDKILYSPSRVEYGSELLFENGQLLEPTSGYLMKKRIALVNAGDLWEVANIIGTITPGGEPRELTAQEIGLLIATVPTIDLYGSWFEAELAKLRIEYVTEIVFVDTPDASDVYTMQYWQEL